MASISYVMAAAMAMVVFAALANLVVVQYASGVVRVALDDGARVGSTEGAARCVERVEQMLEAALGGPFGDEIAVECREVGGFVRATADATFRGYAPFVPDMTAVMEAASAIEVLNGGA